ncbi:S26 family signal peptidase [Streptomyces purpurascens]|uniref:S26 family signal peptidase n=1 Tax=Streptomyces purpurascens TaxID=1924 RepID=UPI0033C73AD4
MPMSLAGPAAVVLTVGVLALVLRRCCVLLDVSGGSMRPAFADGDRLLAARLPVRLVHVMSLMRVVRRGTVVAIRLKPAPGPRTADSASPTCMIKRVAALPGQAVPGAERVPAGHVYVLGDHRATSWDSRHAGPIPYERLTAVIVCRVRRGDTSTAGLPTGT